MATAFRLDQWRQIESADSGAESGSEEVATPADPTQPWSVRGTEYIFVPKGICRTVNSDQTPLTNVEGRPPVQTACCRPGKPQYAGRCRYHPNSINHAPPNKVYARVNGNPYRLIVASQREPTAQECFKLFGVERPSFDAEGRLIPEPEDRAPAPAPPRPQSPPELPPSRSLYDDSTKEALENLAGSEDNPENALLAKASLICNEALKETIALLGSIKDAQTTHNKALTETADALTEERRQGQRIRADLSALQATRHQDFDLAQHPAHQQIRQEVSSLERSLLSLRAATGIKCFRWAKRLVEARRRFKTVSPSDYLFVTAAGAQWDSGYYLNHHLRPVLALLKTGNHPGVAGIDWNRIGVRSLRRGANQRRRRLHMDESLQKLLGRWSDRSLKY